MSKNKPKIIENPIYNKNKHTINTSDIDFSEYSSNPLDRIGERNIEHNMMKKRAETYNEVNNLKEGEREAREKENNKYLKGIFENSEEIIKSSESSQKMLFLISGAINNANKNKDEILEQLKENKNINADVLSVLSKINIDNEKERIEAANSLMSKIKDPLTVLNTLITILTLLI